MVTILVASKADLLDIVGMTTHAGHVPLAVDWLPKPYAPKTISIVRANTSCALGLIGSTGRRHAGIFFDDTVFARIFELCFGLEPYPIVLGAPGDDAYYPASSIKTHGLPKQKAQLVLTIGVKRVDTQSGNAMVDVAQWPRLQKDCNGNGMLKLLGEVNEQFTLSQGGLPPLFNSCDAASCHRKLNLMTLGGLPRSQYNDLVFWKDCSLAPFPSRSSFHCYGFRILLYKKKHPFYGALDALHITKRVAAALGVGSRLIEVAALTAFLCATLVGEKARVPLNVYLLKDIQDDKTGQWMLSESVCGQTWDGPGLLLLQHLVNQVLAPWVSSPAFDPLVAMEVSLTGYYGLLCNTMDVMGRYGTAWESHWLSLTTLRNLSLLMLCFFFRASCWF